MTCPAVLYVWLPLTTFNGVPAGTPVLSGPGFPPDGGGADGCELVAGGGADDVVGGGVAVVDGAADVVGAGLGAGFIVVAEWLGHGW